MTPRPTYLSHLICTGTALAALGFVLATPRVELLRPRFGLPTFAKRGEVVKPEVRRLNPWAQAPAASEVHPEPFPGRPLRVVHVADLPSIDDTARLDQWVLEMRLVAPDLILATGDISYVETQAWYDRLKAAFDATGVPVVAVTGNHERKDRPLWIRNYGPVGNHRVDVGPLAILSLDTAHGRDAFTPSQMQWLEGALASAKLAGKTILIQAHHPIFPAGRDGKGEGHGSGGDLKIFKRRFLALCRQYQVAAVLSGHWHQDAVFDLEGRFREDTPDFPGTKFITTTSLGGASRLVTTWSVRQEGWRMLTFQDGQLVSYTHDPELKGRRMPVWSQPLGRIQVTHTQGPDGAWTGAVVKNGTDQALRGQLPLPGGRSISVDVPPGETRTVGAQAAEEVK